MEGTHAPNCDWRGGKGVPCRQFSTDGTRLGADIAHTMGTTSEAEITDQGLAEMALNTQAKLTGMDAEQADWDDDDADVWGDALNWYEQ